MLHHVLPGINLSAQYVKFFPLIHNFCDSHFYLQINFKVDRVGEVGLGTEQLQRDCKYFDLNILIEKVLIIQHDLFTHADFFFLNP